MDIPQLLSIIYILSYWGGSKNPKGNKMTEQRSNRETKQNNVAHRLLTTNITWCLARDWWNVGRSYWLRSGRHRPGRPRGPWRNWWRINYRCGKKYSSKHMQTARQNI